MTQIKIFTGYAEDVERIANNWLGENKNINILDIKLAAANSITKIMIVYLKPEEKDYSGYNIAVTETAAAIKNCFNNTMSPELKAELERRLGSIVKDL